MHLCLSKKRGSCWRGEDRSSQNPNPNLNSSFKGREQEKDTKVMSLWKKMVCPVRKLLFAIAARVKSRKDGASLLKLHNDIQTCGYQDIQVMWEMIRRSESELISQSSKQKQRSFWRFFIWHNHDRGHIAP